MSSFISNTVNAQCTSITSFTVSSQNATCTANGSITITVPTLSTGSYCTWTAQITRTGSNPVAQNIPTSGGDLIFGSLLPGEYAILVTDGNTILTHSPNVNVTTSYVTMSLMSTSVAPSCNTSQNGTLTVNVANGVGPFVYTVNSLFGTQTHTTANRSHTFENMGAGETVSITVTDQVNGQSGCSTSVNGTHNTVTVSTAPINYFLRPYNFERDCSSAPGSCSGIKLFVNLTNVTTGRLAVLQDTGNATITIAGVSYPLTFVGVEGPATRFTYDPVTTGGPILIHNTPFSTSFDDGCTVITKAATAIMKDDFLILNRSVVLDPETCEKRFRIRIIGDEDLQQNGDTHRAVYYCDVNQVQIERRDDSDLSIWHIVPNEEIEPDPSLTNNALGVNLGVRIPSAVASYAVASTGVYRVTVSDACQGSVSKVIQLIDENPLGVVNLAESPSIIEGTSTIKVDFPGLPPMQTPLKITVSRVDGQSSITHIANGPGDLAGTYQYNFPFDVIFNDYPTPEMFIGDLPEGEYQIKIEDNCSSETGYSIVRNINLTNLTQYSPEINIIDGCANSSTVAFNMNPVNALNVSINVQLRVKNQDGTIGAIAASHFGALSGVFNNVSSGDYFIVYKDVRYVNQTFPERLYSAAFGNFGFREYTQEVTVAPFEDFEVDTSIAFCSIGDPSSGIVSAQITSGTIVYPVSFTLFETSDPTIPLSTVDILDGETNAVFQNVQVGDYFIRVATGCSSKDIAVSVTTTTTIPQARVSEGAVCPGSPTTLAAISATNNLYDIDWEIKNADGTYSPALGADGVQLTGMPVPLSPTVTTTYRAVFSLKTTFGCSNNVTYFSEVEVKVTPDPDLVTPTVTDIDLCKNPNPSVTISNSEAGFEYEILNPQGFSFSPKITGQGNGGDLVIAIPFNQLTAGTTLTVSSTNGNGGCSGILEEEINVIASPADLLLDVEGSFVCLGSDGTITVKGSESGITYTVFQGSLALSPNISSVGTGNDLIFTIPSVLLTQSSNEFTIEASGAGCEAGVLGEAAIITVQQAPSSSSSVNAICGLNDGKGTIVVDTFGGSGDHEYSLDDDTWQDSNIFEVDPGTYTVYSRDKVNGCKSSSSVTIGLYCITITKEASQSTYVLGDVITYTFTVENDGDFTLTNVGVSDALPGLSAITQTSGTTTLAPGGSAEFTATYTITQADVDNGSVVNTATATGTPPTGTDVTATDTETITVDNSAATASITITKSASQSTYGLGDVITYTFTVENTGDFTLIGVKVEDALPGLSAITQTSGTTTLAPGGSAEFTATYTITQADVDNGSVVNTATATGTPPTGSDVTATDTETITVDNSAATASISIAKSASQS
ncbi:COG1470 family protein, partial [Belliella aquatica]